MADFTVPLADADDETIAAALEGALVPPLLAAVAGATDDPQLPPEDLRPDFAVIFDPAAGLSEEQLARGRAIALDALRALRDSGRAPRPGATPAPLDTDHLRQVLSYLTAGQAEDSYLELLRDELNLGEDPRTPAWRKDEIAPDRRFRVVIVGAGMSGIVAAHRLNQAGVEVVVVEKSDGVGGTWNDNSYPGCRVDVNNLFYCYSFAQRDDWPENYSPQKVLLDYFNSVVDDNDLRRLIRFNREVTRLELDEATMTWTVDVRDRDGGGDETIEADAVVSGTGQLNRPNIPTLAGAETFTGPTFHSARWDHTVDLRGERVVVIGTGASAAQLIPEVAKEAGALTILQRTPPWFLPTEDYHDAVTPEVRWLFRNVPGYVNWLRFWIFWLNVEGLIVAARVDPEWEGGGESVSAVNEFVRQMFTEYLRTEFEDRPDLLEKVQPHYEPFSKRFIRDDGTWARTLKRDNVRLVTEAIETITPEGVRTVDGELHRADVLIYGTGFTASEFLMPMEVVGRDGVELHERWKGDARAFLGITLPGYPNLFLMYGPNTNIVVNGSITYFSECEAQHIVGCVEHLLRTGARALEPTQEAHDAYNEKVDAENLEMAWGVTSVNSWYRNATGRSAQNWPFTLKDYWEWTRTPDPGDYRFF